LAIPQAHRVPAADFLLARRAPPSLAALLPARACARCQVEIPNVDDHISKLEHMGKETVKKLQDIHGSALAAGIDIAVPDNRINKGGWGPPAPACLHACAPGSCAGGAVEGWLRWQGKALAAEVEPL
jgi:hypothetical protein